MARRRAGLDSGASVRAEQVVRARTAAPARPLARRLDCRCASGCRPGRLRRVTSSSARPRSRRIGDGHRWPSSRARTAHGHEPPETATGGASDPAGVRSARRAPWRSPRRAEVPSATWPAAIAGDVRRGCADAPRTAPSTAIVAVADAGCDARASTTARVAERERRPDPDPARGRVALLHARRTAADPSQGAGSARCRSGTASGSSIQTSAPRRAVGRAGVAAVRRGDQLDDREAEARAAPAARLVGPAEAVERAWQERPRGTRRHRRRRAARPGPCARRGEDDRLGAVPERVVDEVPDRLREPVGIGVEPDVVALDDERALAQAVGPPPEKRRATGREDVLGGDELAGGSGAAPRSARAISSRSSARRERRSVSSAAERSVASSSPALRWRRSVTSISARSSASGVRSSWLASATNRRSCSNAASSRSSISLSVVARREISSWLARHRAAAPATTPRPPRRGGASPRPGAAPPPRARSRRARRSRSASGPATSSSAKRWSSDSSRGSSERATAIAWPCRAARDARARASRPRGRSA